MFSYYLLLAMAVSWLNLTWITAWLAATLSNLRCIAGSRVYVEFAHLQLMPPNSTFVTCSKLIAQSTIQKLSSYPAPNSANGSHAKCRSIFIVPSDKLEICRFLYSWHQLITVTVTSFYKVNKYSLRIIKAAILLPKWTTSLKLQIRHPLGTFL